jgi:hypothetical protein
MGDDDPPAADLRPLIIQDLRRDRVMGPGETASNRLGGW